MKNYDLVIFDIDGTLVHTPWEYLAAKFKETFRSFRVSITDEAFLRRLWVGPDREAILRDYNLTEGQFWDRFSKFDTYESRSKVNMVYNDVAEIYRLRERDVKIAAFTNANESVALANLNLLYKVGNRRVFDYVLIAHKNSSLVKSGLINPKPDSRGVDLCLVGTGVKDKKRVVMVGDLEDDISSARAAGVLDVLIDRGESPLMAVVPSRTIRNLSELVNLIFE